MAPVRYVAALVGVLIVGAAASVAAPVDAAENERAALELATQHGAPGDVVGVRLDRWPAGVVTLATCGNDARRGSRDCDLVGAQAVNVTRDGPTTFDFRLTTPPVGCPCVVRASDPTNAGVRTVPVVLQGVADGPVLTEPGAQAPELQVLARVTAGESSWPASLLAATGGTATRRLVVVVRNRGATELSGLRVTAVAGRDRHSGSVVARRSVPTLAPGASSRVVMTVELPTPAFGDYVVYGRVVGTTTSSAFSATTAADPWAWWLLAPIALLALARVLRRRERASVAALDHPRELERVIVLPPLPDCSPDVGGHSDERWALPSYPATVPAPNGSGSDAPVPHPA